MGYEIKLVVGHCSGHGTPEMKKGEWQLDEDGDPPYRPYARDADDNFIPTGRTELYFQVYGMVELCCPGAGHLLKLDWKNPAKNLLCWFYYLGDGDKDIREDAYGDYAQPIPVVDVIEALEKDYAESGYRRFKWALAFLKGFEDEPETQVLFYGH